MSERLICVSYLSNTGCRGRPKDTELCQGRTSLVPSLHTSSPFSAIPCETRTGSQNRRIQSIPSAGPRRTTTTQTSRIRRIDDRTTCLRAKDIIMCEREHISPKVPDNVCPSSLLHSMASVNICVITHSGKKDLRTLAFEDPMCLPVEAFRGHPPKSVRPSTKCKQCFHG